MVQTLTVNLPDELDRALRKEAARTGKSPEQVALEWIGSHATLPPHGSAEALMLTYGAWSMAPEERVQIEQMIEQDRLLEENCQ